MPIKIVSIICEGPHDVAFLNRMLKAQGFRTNEKVKISEYPFPMGQFFETSLKKSDFRQLNFAEARQVPLPSHALSKSHVYVFLYSLGGDSKQAERSALMRRMASFFPSDDHEIRVLPRDTSLSLIFMFDADNYGVNRRLASMKAEIASALELDAAEIEMNQNGEVFQVNGLVVGCLVLTDESAENGKLEDVLLPLMKDGNEHIFEAAESFINSHYDEGRTKFLRIRSNENSLQETRGGDSDFDRKKSLIGVVAQLQISGKPNQACINRTDYLTIEKLLNCPHCAMLRDFLLKVTTT